MSKKIAMILILTMVVNICAWAEESSTGTIVGIIIGGAVIIGFTVAMTVVLMVADADEPDDGLRLASWQSSRFDTGTGFGYALNFLQKIDLGVTQDNKVYMGLRLQF